MTEILTQAAQLILSLTILVIAHEAGHFFFAKLFGVRVERFYMFFNAGFSIFKTKKVNGKWKFKFLSKNDPYNDKPIEELDDNDWRKYPQNTEFGIGWLPLGGYCKISGMVDESMDTKGLASEPKKWEYRGVSTWKRLPIITGGVLVNFILAIVIYTGVLYHYGSADVMFSDFKKGFEFTQVAKEAGFQDGDQIVQIDGDDVGEFETNAIRRIMKAQTVAVERNGQRHTLSIPDDFGQRVIRSQEQFISPIMPFVIDSVFPNSPAFSAKLEANDSILAVNGLHSDRYNALREQIAKNGNKRIRIDFIRNDEALSTYITPDSAGRIGVLCKGYGDFYSFTKHEYTLGEAICYGFTTGISNLTGYVSDFRYIFGEDGLKNLGGFGSIGKSFAPTWDWHWFWNMTALLSVILAFMNILPIPGLDGGHLMFLLYEMLTGKKPSQRFLETAQVIGMIFILMLFIYANINDIFR